MAAHRLHNFVFTLAIISPENSRQFQHLFFWLVSPGLPDILTRVWPFYFTIRRRSWKWSIDVDAQIPISRSALTKRWTGAIPTIYIYIYIYIYIRGAFNKFPDFFVQAFKIVINSWKLENFPIHLMRWLANFYDFSFKWAATEKLEYTLLKPDCHSWWISKMQSDTLKNDIQ